MTEEMGRKNKLLNPAFIISPLFTARKTQLWHIKIITSLCVCVCVCVRAQETLLHISCCRWSRELSFRSHPSVWQSSTCVWGTAGMCLSGPGEHCVAHLEAALMTWQIVWHAVCVCAFIEMSYYTLWSADWWLCAHIPLNDEPALFVCLPRCVCALCPVYSWSRHPAPVSCLRRRWKQIESLETLGSRIWNMLMNRHHNNPSSHTRQKENEKLRKRILSSSDLVSRPHLNYLILAEGNICWFEEIVLTSE